jgi:hypothetical protein
LGYSFASEYAKATPNEGLWRISRYQSEIEVGDTVFLWRAIGQGKRSLAGIFAEAKLITCAAPQQDTSNFRAYWLDRSDVIHVEPRAMIRMVRVAKMPVLLRLDDIKEDPILSHLGILTAANATNFKTSEDEAKRLQRLWNKLGSDWSRKDEIDALKGYNDGTSPSDLTLKVDRPLSDVRKKLASFQSYDPCSRFYSPSTPSSDLWQEFFDKEANRLSREALELARAAL